MLAAEQQREQQRVGEAAKSNVDVLRQQQRFGGAAASNVDVWRLQQQRVRQRRRTPKAVAEVKMAAAIGIILLNFFSHCCGLCFCLASVELYGRNSTTRNIAIFPLSQGIYPAGGRIYPKQRERLLNRACGIY